MGVLDLIYRGTRNTAQPTQATPPVVFDPATGQAVIVPTGTPPIAPQPQAAPAPVAAQQPTPTIMGAIGGLLAPEAGSFWDQAMEHGIFGAKRGMQEYADQRQNTAEARRSTANEQYSSELKNRVDTENARYTDQAAGGVIWRRDPATGKYEAVTEPVTQPRQPGEQETLIEMWKNAPEGSRLQALIERAIRGFQYTPQVIQLQTEGRKEVKRTTPGKAPSSSSAKPPSGFIVDPE